MKTNDINDMVLGPFEECDITPTGSHRAQLDRIEAKLDALLIASGAPLQGGTEGFDEVLKAWQKNK